MKKLSVKSFFSCIVLIGGCFSLWSQEPMNPVLTPGGPGPVISNPNVPLPGPQATPPPAPNPSVPAPAPNPSIPAPAPNPGMPSPMPNPAPPAGGAPQGWATPGILGNPPAADWMNQGTLNVMATGYDSQGVLKQIPLNISYNFNGVSYNVTVNNAWNPYTETWTIGIDIPAFSTSYYLNGFTYNYYANLPIGTFYFNL